jgi:hypothetical protein
MTGSRRRGWRRRVVPCGDWPFSFAYLDLHLQRGVCFLFGLLCGLIYVVIYIPKISE